MADNIELMRTQLALWEDTLERAGIDLEHARKFDDYGAIEFNEEMIRWAKMKINDIQDYLDIQKGA